jgi:WD40 repeat protein
MSAAWGGQILLTPEVTAASALPEGANLLDLGQHLLKNVSAPQQLYQLDHPQLARHEFPPPRTLSGQSIRQAVNEGGGQLAGLAPQAMGLALLSATLLPVLQGELDPESGALTGNLGVLEELGAVSLRGIVAGFAEQLRAGERLPATELRGWLQRELQVRWQAGGESALALRADASRLLQAVHGVEAAMTAASGEVKEALARGLADLGEQFGEFRWMLAGLQDTLSEMRARQALQLALQREQLDLQRQQLVKTNLILHRQPGAAVRAEIAPGEAQVEDLPPADVACPYMGLAAFEPDDAGYFFGREELVAQLTARLAGTRFLAVVGPSGSGKSSLVRAGLLPALWAGALPGSQTWQTLVLTPGAHPLNELAVRLSVLSDDRPAALLRDLEADHRTLDLTIRHTLSGEPDQVKLLLVVDQFEEVFALCHDEGERRRFIEALLYAVEAEEGRTVVVPTIRADFYGRCAEYPKLAARLSDGLLVGPMAEDELRAAIERPAAVVGLRLEPGLADLILGDVAGEPGALPLMSHALLETFDRRQGRTLTLSGYTAAGGVSGAIAQTADTVYAGFEPEEQMLARSIFLRLTELGDEGAHDTRRRVAPSELVHSPADTDAVERVLKTLADARLVTTGGPVPPVPSRVEGSAVEGPVPPVPGRVEGTTVEVAHEALIREWPALRGWLDQDREGLRIHRHLTVAATEWAHLGREPGELYRGARLAAATESVEGNDGALNPLEREFLAASQELARRREAEREATLARERALERRSLQRLRIIVGVLVLASVAGIVLTLALMNQSQAARSSAADARLQQAAAETEAQARATQQAVAETEAQARATQQVLAETEADARATQEAVALAERDRADEEADLALSRELAAAALNNLEVDPDRSVLLALEALSIAHTQEAENALHQTVPALHLSMTLSGHPRVFDDIVVSQDGTRLATASQERYGPAGSQDRKAQLWDAASGRELLNLDLRYQTGADLRPSVTFSPDGSYLASTVMREDLDSGVGLAEAVVVIWDTASGNEALTLLEGQQIGLFEIAFSPDGSLLAAARQDATAKVWEVASGRQVLTLEGHANAPAAGRLNPDEHGVFDVVFAPDGTRLATAGSDGTARVWDAASGQESMVLSGHVNEVNEVAFHPDGTHLVTAGYDGTARVWDLSPGADEDRQRLIIYHRQPLNSAVFSPDGKRIATGGADGIARVWDASSGQLLLALHGHTGSIARVAFFPDGKRLATASEDTTVRVWDLLPDRELLTLVAHGTAVRSVAYSPDGAWIATAGADGTAQVWDPQTGEPQLTLSGHGGRINSIAYSDKGERLVTAGQDGAAKVWDSASGEGLLSLSHPAAVQVATFGPGGTLVGTTSGDGMARIWDATTGQTLRVLVGHTTETLPDLAFSPDGKRLATAGWDGQAIVWDVEAGQALSILRTGEAAYGVAFHPEGRWLAVSVRDGTTGLWDLSLDTPEVMVTLAGHSGPVTRVAFSADGTRLTTVGQDGTARLWDVDASLTTGSGVEVLTLFAHTGGVADVSFSPDGAHLATAGFDGRARVFALDLEELVALAESRLTRTLTTEECQRYLHLDECPVRP